MGEAFCKLSGAGNDFLAFEGEALPPPERIRDWCRRGLSVGADGVLVLRPDGDGVRLLHANADGSRSDLCLNGSRCAALLAFERGWNAPGGDELRLVTDAGTLRCRRRGLDLVELALPAELAATPAEVELEHAGARYRGWRLDVGVPHLVLTWPESLATAPVAEAGPALRRHRDLGTAGANVHFVRFPAPGRLQIRSFERGVEAETLACGTGVVAAVAAGVAARRLRTPVAALTAGGCELTVAGDPLTGDGLSLTGDARIVYRGELGAGAEDLPPAPRWSSDDGPG